MITKKMLMSRKQFKKHAVETGLQQTWKAYKENYKQSLKKRISDNKFWSN